LQRYLEAMEAKETEKKFLQYVGKIAVDWPTIREKELQEVRNMLNITSTVDKFQLQIANNFSDFTVQ
jgi:ubiquinone biosynthesis protein Coq4